MSEKYPLNELKSEALQIEKQLKSVFQRYKKKNKKMLDTIVHELHEKSFRNIDCLDCGNCCRHLGPGIKETDIDILSKHFKIKPKEFIDRYLIIDEDNDFVFNAMPCPFLGDDNYCHVYEVRPKACREYPHTDRNKIIQISDVIILNNKICPASLYVSRNLIVMG